MNLDISKLSVKEKFIAIEDIWSSLEKDIYISEFTPKWHIDILDKLEEKEKENSLEFIDFTKAKDEIRKLLK